MKRMSRVFCVFILIICWHQTADISQAEFPICTEPGHQGKPDIWGDWVVWHDNREGDGYNIYGKNLSSGEEIQISDSNTAFCPSIHSELVVWQDKRNGDFDIYRYNLVTRTESPLYIADGNQVNPSIYGDTVVWRTGQYPSWPEVWGYSIAQGTALLITDAPGNKWEPDVFGDVVVWGDYRNGNWDIYAADISDPNNPVEFAIATGPAYQRSVAIYGNTVVYENWRSSGNQGVGIYDLITQEHAYHLTPGDCDWLAISVTVVVWGDYRNEGTDIYGYKIFTGEEFSIYTGVGWQYCPAIYRDKVVWSDDGSGGFSERDIYGAMVSKHLYVDANASGNNDGSTWADAYNCLQDALAVALGGDDIFVASATYKPDLGANQTPGDRAASFELVNGVAIYGGFAGGETSFDQRAWKTNETILSGDIGAPDVNSDNSYHVVTGSGTDASTVMDGFTIRAGNANGSYPDDLGGGMFIEFGSPALTNCMFNGNFASNSGGGMYNNFGSPLLNKCTFSGNSASDGGGLYGFEGSITNCIIADNTATTRGGGISSCNGLIIDSNISGNWSGENGGGLYDCNSSIINCIINSNTADQTGGGLHGCGGPIINCSISNNHAGYYGGGISSCSGLITDSTISGNQSDENGGGLYDCNNAIINCIINGNTAVQTGGGLHGCDGTIINCTISNNYAGSYGGGLHGCEGSITNCILWYNNADVGGEQLYSSSDPTYSCIQDWTGGLGNIVDDPCFVQPGYWADANDPKIVVEANEPNAVSVDGDYHLSPGSPCIDRGDDTAVPYDGLDLDGDGDVNERIPFDLDGNPRFLDDPVTDDNGVPDLPAYPEIVDMGAYEYVLKIHNVNQDTYHRTIQDAIDAAFDRDEIVVYPGTYSTYRNRDLNFDGKAITVRSTYLNTPDTIAATVISCRGSEADPHRGFSFHSGEAADSVLSGFTITNGYASEGGGIYCSQSSPTIRNCVIKNNHGSLRGGGIFLSESSANLINCTIGQNVADDVGAGIYANLGSPEISNCTITANIAEQSGAGLWLEGGNPVLRSCLITGNVAISNNGGGVHGCDGLIINCTISGNHAGQYGGGLHSCDGSITNCIIWYNTAAGGDGSQLYSSSDPNYSCIQSWTGGGIGNIVDDPCLARPGYRDDNGTPLDPADDFWVNGDYHLLSASHCIDAGDPCYTAEPNETDLDGSPRIVDGDDDGSAVVDMGAYESLVALCPVYDLDDDWFIGVSDLSLFACCWMHPVDDIGCFGVIPCVDSDFDCDGFVGVGDLSYFATCWLKDNDYPLGRQPPCQSASLVEGQSALGASAFESSDAGGNLSLVDSVPQCYKPDVEIRLVLLSSPSSSDKMDVLPSSIQSVSVGQDFYIEVWASDVGSTNTGLTSLYVNVRFEPCSALSVQSIDHAEIFTTFPSGEILSCGIDELGGSSLAGAGVAPEWARVAVVSARSESTEPVIFSLSESFAGIAAFGRGIIPLSEVDMGKAGIPDICGDTDHPYPVGDLDYDCYVDWSDIGVLSAHWLETGGADAQWCAIEGLYENGRVDLADLAVLASHWLECTAPECD